MLSTNRILGVLSLLGGAAAIPLMFAFLNVGWGDPGTAAYQRYETLNRLTSVALLFIAAGWWGVVQLIRPVNEPRWSRCGRRRYLAQPILATLECAAAPGGFSPGSRNPCLFALRRTNYAGAGATLLYSWRNMDYLPKKRFAVRAALMGK
ncbi:MAG: hypothetical protein L0332_24575 [Chloroflexi bacterium]|nr:hypothetical protein [Chloroflexota bacterium]MCI0579881.1 hypothetical protein [Chloroflexota bacterium]MCI0646162.1 hypothetical protein [Chloroflexota bacterium]MCI0729872.1 hypothetical protein [Chloroflexota bacterium]